MKFEQTCKLKDMQLQLEELFEEKGSFLDSDVQELSRKIDELIVKMLKKEE